MRKNLIPGQKSSQAPGTALVVVAVFLSLTLVFAPSGWAASKYKTLYRFKGGTDGKQPLGDVIFDPAGNLYGTTLAGGVHRDGAVFKLTRNQDGNWTESVLHSFHKDGTDGYHPIGGLIVDLVGNLYGTTQQGGANGVGTVFALTPNGDGTWTESVLHSFNPHVNDGHGPGAGLIMDSAGNLYGTTSFGGASNGGTVFQLSPNSNGSWTESVLYSFSFDGTDGSGPAAGVTLDGAGNVYGTTEFGGTYAFGTVFELTPNGDGTWTESVLYSFNPYVNDGYDPVAGLIFDLSGNLYSTALFGGAYNGGIVFELTPNSDGSWTEGVLYSFGKDGKDGYRLTGGLVFDPAGNLFGTTNQGGAYYFGTVFQLKPGGKGEWKETVLHSFRNHPGAHPYAGLTLDGQGHLYGTTQGNGNKTHGSVFKITP